MAEEEKKESNSKATLYNILSGVILLGALIGLILIIVWIPYWLPTDYLAFLDKHGGIGIFGDMFGSLNAVFSGLALLGVVWGIHMQRQELKLQREELRDTREEFVKQNETLKIQRFENTFFQLLSALNKAFETSKVSDIEKFHGASDINTFSRDMVNLIDGKYFENREIPFHDFRYGFNQNIFDLMFKRLYFFKSSGYDLYVKSFVSILRLVHLTSVYNDIKKDRELRLYYLSILKGYLSNEEVQFIFFLGLSYIGRDSLKGFLEEYSFFYGSLTVKFMDSLEGEYKKSAFTF